MSYRNPVYGRVEEVYHSGGIQYVDVQLTEPQNMRMEAVPVIRQAAGNIEYPKTGWMARIVTDQQGQRGVTGFSTPSNDFEQTEMEPGSSVTQVNEDTGEVYDAGSGEARYHSGDTFVIRSGGEFDIQRNVPSGGASGLTDGSRNGGEEMKLPSLQEWQETQQQLQETLDRVQELESASYSTEAGRQSYRNNRDIEYIENNTPAIGQTPDPVDIQPGSTVDAVADLGWDDTGGSAINLDNYIQDDLEIQVPAGRFRIGNSSSADADNFKLIGAGKGETIFETGDGNDAMWLLNMDNVSNVEVGGFTCDLDDTETGAGPGISMRVDDNVTVRDVDYAGFTPSDSSGNYPGDFYWCYVVVLNSGGEAHIKNVTKTGPSDIRGHKDGPGMGLCPIGGHKGTLYITNTRIENDNGDTPWYTTGSGLVIHDNCYHANNAMAQFRIGGNSVVRNCTAVVDVPNAHPENTGSYADAGDLDGSGSCNGIYLAGQGADMHGGRVENTTFNFISTGPANGRPVSVDGSQAGTLFKNITIQYEANGGELVGDKRGPYDLNPPRNLDFKGCTFTGGGSPEYIFELDYHDGNLIEASDITITPTNSIFNNSGDWDKTDYTT